MVARQILRLSRRRRARRVLRRHLALRVVYVHGGHVAAYLLHAMPFPIVHVSSGAVDRVGDLAVLGVISDAVPADGLQVACAVVAAALDNQLVVGVEVGVALGRKRQRRDPTVGADIAVAKTEVGIPADVVFVVLRPGNTLARAVQSGLRGLTAVFGMGTGGSLSLESPRRSGLNIDGPALEETLYEQQILWSS